MLDSGYVSEGMVETSGQKDENRNRRQARSSALEIDLRIAEKEERSGAKMML